MTQSEVESSLTGKSILVSLSLESSKTEEVSLCCLKAAKEV